MSNDENRLNFQKNAGWLPYLLLAIGSGISAYLMTQRQVRVDVTCDVIIDATRKDIWNYLSDFEGHWEKSNPDIHLGTQVLSTPKQPLRDGLRFYQKEKIGGVVGELNAELYDVNNQHSFRWRADTTYYLLGMSYDIQEGGTVRIESTNQNTGLRLSHRVRGTFPDTLAGRLLGWWMLNVFSLREDMTHHTQIELNYFKQIIEDDTHSHHHA